MDEEDAGKGGGGDEFVCGGGEYDDADVERDVILLLEGLIVLLLL